MTRLHTESFCDGRENVAIVSGFSLPPSWRAVWCQKSQQAAPGKEGVRGVQGEEASHLALLRKGQEDCGL